VPNELTNQLIIKRSKIVYNPDISLAMYRELASHIEQIADVQAELFWQESQEFSYLGSQIGGMWLSHAEIMPTESQNLIKNILDHYGTWLDS
jgi:hypothetical protein